MASEKMDTYCRAMLAWLAVLSENRRLGSHADWLLPHVILVREMSSDDIMLADPADPYHPGRQDLLALRAVSERVAIHLCSQMTAAAPETWQADAVKALKDSSTGQDAPTKQLAVLLKQITASNELSYASRVFTSCLAMLLHQSGATQSDREEWLGLARTWQSKSESNHFAADFVLQAERSPPDIHICLAILTALRHTLSESPRLQRYQGEVASSLAGVKPSKVIEEGLPGLQTLLALAAASSSDADLLPPNRAIFFMQGLQKWKLFDSDSESDEAADGEPLDAACPLILRVCAHLISAIQDLAGSHWDFIFDLTEYAVEVRRLNGFVLWYVSLQPLSIQSFSWDEPATYAGLSAACELLEEIRVRSSINKGFRKLVQSSLIRSLRYLAPVFLNAPDAKAITLNLLSTMSHILSESDSFTSGDIPKVSVHSTSDHRSSKRDS